MDKMIDISSRISIYFSPMESKTSTRLDCCCWSPQITPVSPLCPYCGVSPPLLSPVSSEAECCSQETAAEVAEVQSLSIYNIVLVSSQPPGYRIGEIQMIPGVDFTETGICRNFGICKHATVATGHLKLHKHRHLYIRLPQLQEWSEILHSKSC